MLSRFMAFLLPPGKPVSSALRPRHGSKLWRRISPRVEAAEILPRLASVTNLLCWRFNRTIPLLTDQLGGVGPAQILPCLAGPFRSHLRIITMLASIKADHLRFENERI
jgi:hypothetical protein